MKSSSNKNPEYNFCKKMGYKIAFVSWLYVMLFPICELHADGVVFPPVITEGGMRVKPTRQRAIVWLRNGTWEIHIQPVFERESGGAAWVVPFPNRPEIQEGSIELLDQLEFLTSPVFITACRIPLYGSDAGIDGGIDDKKIEGANNKIDVWDQGTVGQLDYAVVSAGEGGDIKKWLEDNGYYLPPAMTPMIDTLTQEGQFFFAARLSPEADPSKPLSPVRFVLKDMNQAVYPLRLTGQGMSDGVLLDFTLWLISPNLSEGVESHKISNHAVVSLGEFSQFDICNERDYDSALRSIYTRGAIALVFGDELYENVNHREIQTRIGPVRYEQISTNVPDRWNDDILEIAEARYWVQRYQASFNAAAMSEDIVFASSSKYPYLDHNVWIVYTGYCNDVGSGSSCSSPGETPPSALLWSVLLVLAGLYVRRHA